MFKKLRTNASSKTVEKAIFDIMVSWSKAYLNSREYTQALPATYIIQKGNKFWGYRGVHNNNWYDTLKEAQENSTNTVTTYPYEH